MTNKAQTMLTIALTAAVSVLLVDRIIEPAQAQNCASPYDVMDVGADVRELLTEMDIAQMKMETLNMKLDELQRMHR
jgi:hypothetical protein